MNTEWKRVAPVELPPAYEPVLVIFEGRIEIATHEGGEWYIRRLGRWGNPGAVTWWRPMPEGPGGEV